MYLVVIAWLYVTVMMAIVEATSPTGTVLGAAITFVFYGLLPMGIVVYIIGTPSRKRAIKAREQAQQAAYESQQAQAQAQVVVCDAEHLLITPDTSSQTATGAQDAGIAPVREKP